MPNMRSKSIKIFIRPFRPYTIFFVFSLLVVINPSNPQIVYAGSSAATQFSIFDGMHYPNKPDLTQYGLEQIYIAYESEIWGRGGITQQIPNQASVIALAKKIPPNVPLVLDVEQWAVEGNDTVVTSSIDKLTQIVDWIHQANPAVKVGYFGIMPISNPWRELNYARILNNPHAPAAANYVKNYKSWQSDNTNMEQLASHVDFVCPVVYTFYNLNGATYNACWDLATINAISEAQKYGKPIYAFVWPQFDDVQSANGDHVFIPASFWQHELQLINSLNANGLVLWGSTTYRKAGWNGADPWWQATLAFMSNLGL